MKRLKLFFRYLYSYNFPNTPVYKTTLFQKYYKYRIGFGTAWELAKLISDEN